MVLRGRRKSTSSWEKGNHSHERRTALRPLQSQAERRHITVPGHGQGMLEKTSAVSGEILHQLIPRDSGEAKEEDGVRIHIMGICCNVETAQRIDSNNQPNLFGPLAQCQICGSIWEPFWWIPEADREEFARTHHFDAEKQDWVQNF